MEIDQPTADLIEKCFREGEIAARRDRDKPVEENTECPHEHDLKRTWWYRGYRSQEDHNFVLAQMNRLNPPELKGIPLADGTFDYDW